MTTDPKLAGTENRIWPETIFYKKFVVWHLHFPNTWIASKCADSSAKLENSSLVYQRLPLLQFKHKHITYLTLHKSEEAGKYPFTRFTSTWASFSSSTKQTAWPWEKDGMFLLGTEILFCWQRSFLFESSMDNPFLNDKTKRKTSCSCFHLIYIFGPFALS